MTEISRVLLQELQKYRVLVVVQHRIDVARLGCGPCSNLRVCSFFRLHEFDEQVAWVREGMAKVIPVPLLSLFTGYELETMVTALCFAIQCKLPNDTEFMSKFLSFCI